MAATIFCAVFLKLKKSIGLVPILLKVYLVLILLILVLFQHLCRAFGIHQFYIHDHVDFEWNYYFVGVAIYSYHTLEFLQKC